MSFEPAAFRIGPHVRFRLIEGEAVVLRQKEGEVLVLNEVGSRILQLASEGHPSSRIVELLLQEFEVEESRLARDVEAFLQEMGEEGILIPLEA